MSDWVFYPAPAKLNLFLHITGRRDDGYHLLQTLFQFIDLCDDIGFRVRSDGQIRRITDIPGVPEASDLIVRAAQMLKPYARVGAGVDLQLEKRIPMGGGLGGGSSDAATVLVVLNALWECGLTQAQLAELAVTLGADVPIFVYGKAAWAEGIGEILTPVEPPEPCYLVVHPGVEVPTKALFADQSLTRDCPPIKMRDFLNGAGQNVFEPVVRKRFPEVDQAMVWLSEFANPILTGSGSCFFAEFANSEIAAKIHARLPSNWQAFVVKGLNHSPLCVE